MTPDTTLILRTISISSVFAVEQGDQFNIKSKGSVTCKLDWLKIVEKTRYRERNLLVQEHDEGILYLQSSYQSDVNCCE